MSVGLWLRRRLLLAAPLVLLAGVVLFLTLVAAPRERARFEERWRSQLVAMVDDRESAIERWVADGLNEATVVAGYPTIAYILSGADSGPKPFPAEEGAGVHLTALLQSVVASSGYTGALVIDGTGAVVASAAIDKTGEPGCIEFGRLCIAAGRPQADIHAQGASHLVVAFAAPVILAGAREPAGAVVLAADPEGWLFPFLRRVPVASATAETLLIRREGGDAVFLSPLRDRSAAPLTLRVPLSTVGLAAEAALAGRGEVAHRVDYRGVSVLTATRRLNQAPWGLVAKVDSGEVLDGYRRWLAAAVTVLVALTCALVGLGYGLWRQQRARLAVARARSEARYALLLDHAGDAILFHAADGTIREVNERAGELYGYRREELRGRNIASLRMPPQPAIASAHDTTAATGGTARFEEVHVTQAGREVPVEVHAVRVTSEGEEVLLSIVRDASERKRGEEALRVAHARLRRLVDANIVGIVIANSSGDIVEANDYYLQMVGFSRDELARGEIDWRAITPPEWLPADERALSELKERGTCSPYEKEYLRRDGTRVPVLLADAVLPGPGEQIAAFALDLSERSRLEREVSQLNQRLQVLIEAVQALASARDMDGVAVVVRTFARRLGGADGATFVLRDGGQCHYVDEDAIGPLWKGQRFPLEACISGWSILNRVAAVVPDIYLDPRIKVDAYRPTFVKSLVMVPIRMDDPLGAIGTYWAAPHAASDVEVQLLKTLADAAARAVENVRFMGELEARVANRTRDLVAANQELEAFSYSVSHDLRAPLRAIDGFSRMLEEDCRASLDDEGRRLVAVVRDNTRRMGQLIDDLLSFSRVGRAEMHRLRVDMRALARTAYEELADDAARARVELVLGDLPDAVGDRSLLRQGWANLLANALKFTGNCAAPRIAVAGRCDGGKAVYEVADNGAGFDMRYADKLFGVFQRLHGVSEFPGTGVGLALVKRVVTRHGGEVWATGEVGKGATIGFSLPEAREE